MNLKTYFKIFIVFALFLIVTSFVYSQYEYEKENRLNGYYIVVDYLKDDAYSEQGYGPVYLKIRLFDVMDKTNAIRNLLRNYDALIVGPDENNMAYIYFKFNVDRGNNIVYLVTQKGLVNIDNLIDELENLNIGPYTVSIPAVGSSIFYPNKALAIVLRKVKNLVLEEGSILIKEPLVYRGIRPDTDEFHKGVIVCESACDIGTLLNWNKQPKDITAYKAKIEFKIRNKAIITLESEDSYIAGFSNFNLVTNISRAPASIWKSIVSKILGEGLTYYKELITSTGTANNVAAGRMLVNGKIVLDKNQYTLLFRREIGCLPPNFKSYGERFFIPYDMREVIREEGGKYYLRLSNNRNFFCKITLLDRKIDIDTYPPENSEELKSVKGILEKIEKGQQEAFNWQPRNTIIKGKNLRIYNLKSLEDVREMISSFG